MLRSLYVDLNSYFASVEQELNPSLRGRPIAVVPMVADTTSAIAASYEAKAFGVKTGTMVADAKRMCPNIVIVPARHGEYIDYHHKVVEAVERVIHVRRVASIDEMVCDLVGSERVLERALTIAKDVKESIRTHAGSTLRCSVGIAPNDFLAKTATDMQKPDGLVVIDEEDLPTILHRLELQDLCGIGRNMYKRLWARGIYTVEMLCAASKDVLRDVWGGIEGERMWMRLRGLDVPYHEPHKTTVGHSHVLEPKLRTREGALGVLHRLLQKATMRLRRYGLVAGELYVGVRFADKTRFSVARNITPTSDVIQLTALLSAITDEIDNNGVPFKVSVALNKVAPFQAAPEALFSDVGPVRSQLNSSIDAINEKYGKNTLYVGTAWNALQSAPMRIAFTHIPDKEE